MIGAMSGSVSTMDYFLDEGIDKNLKNQRGLGAFELSLLHYTDLVDNWSERYFQDESFRNEDDDKERFVNNLSTSYDKLQYPYIKYQIDKKMIKIYPHSMEYFLLIYFTALKEKMTKDTMNSYRESVVEFKASVDDCLDMNDFMYYIKDMPSSILPDYRKKRQYINSILAKNEIDSNNYYNKKLFVRRVRGCYDLNPELMMWG
jgi:hypothetical protein